MPSRKRAREEVEPKEENAQAPKEITLLDRIRSTSEFAAFNQYLFIFGKAMKVPEFTIEDFEQEFLKPTPSDRIKEVGLALLKNISSHRGLTLELFDEYTRRQYVAKAPTRNPFGVEDEPLNFHDFDFYTKIRVLHQLSIWTFFNYDRMRDKFPDLSFDKQAAEWRMEPYGWDAQGRTYYLLDDDRLYRETEAPIPEPIQKKKKIPAKGRRSSKRGRISRVVDSAPDDSDEEMLEAIAAIEKIEEDKNDLAYEEDYEGKQWECVAIGFDDFQGLVTSFKKSRDADERNLCKRLESEIMPFLIKKEEKRQQEQARRLKELENLQKLATAKRSSRLAGKAEHQREQELLQEAERKRLEELRLAQRDREKQKKIEQDRESRMQTREQRLREREVKRILHEEELRKEEEQLAKLAEEEANGGPAGRVAHRQLQADMAKRQKELEALQAEEQEWVFDCSKCGVHGQNLDDGTASIACDECNVWQHSACHGIAQEQAERDDFQFICKDCKQKKENPVATMKLDSTADDTLSTTTSVVIVPPPTIAAASKGATPKEKKERRPKDLTKPRSNVKIIKKKKESAGSTPVKTKNVASAAVVNGNSPATIKDQSIRSSPQKASTHAGPSSVSGNQTDDQRFIHYQPAQAPVQSLSSSGIANGHLTEAPSVAHQFQRPSHPSFPPPTAPHLQWQKQNGTDSHHQQQGGSPVKSSGPSSSPIPYPSTPAQTGAQRTDSSFIAPDPSSQTQPAQSISSQKPPHTPSFSTAANHSFSSPGQHLVAPSPTYHAPALGASESSNHGSSPGYSPKKHPSPPRPSNNTQHFNGKDSHIKPPVALSPMSRPNITSPPVKRSPPPSVGRLDHTNAASLVDDQARLVPPQLSIVQNVTPNGEAGH